MPVSRREVIIGAGVAAAIQATADTGAIALPAKSDFPVVKSEVCLNNARWHPACTGAIKAIQQYLDYKAGGGGSDPDFGANLQRRAKSLFGTLINAKPAELSFIPSTTVGENLIASALDLPRGGGNVVTDALHFEGSLYQYGELARQGGGQGFDLRIVRPRNWRIELSDLEKVIDSKTKLVAVSFVSMINGFQHDLKAVCDLAHSRGALVYADAVQACGAVPTDVKATGIDFLATSGYKWLMGDMGLGFLYVREDLIDRLKRSQYGFRQLTKMQYHVFPGDPPGDAVMDWTQAADAGGHFEVGTVSNTTLAALTYSLDFIQRVGVDKIQSHRLPLLRRLHQELPKAGFEPMTAADSTSPIATFARKNAGELGPKLRSANIDIALYDHRIRVSPSVYNDQSDIDKLLEAVGASVGR